MAMETLGPRTDEATIAGSISEGARGDDKVCGGGGGGKTSISSSLSEARPPNFSKRAIEGIGKHFGSGDD